MLIKLWHIIETRATIITGFTTQREVITNSLQVTV